MILNVTEIGCLGYKLIKGYSDEVLTLLHSNTLYNINFSEI